MENPFPGVDPWMENQWGDAHHTIITFAREQLRPQLPHDLRARVDARIFVETDSGELQLAASDPTTQGYIEIVDKDGRVITHLEVLSPSNKKGGAGRRQYLDKQSECVEAGVNFVEIDLIRSGQWTVLAPIALVPGPRQAIYRASVWRAARPEFVEFYPAQLRKPLPAISIPLRPGDADVLLSLQPLIDQAYVSGSYDATDYNEDPVPPLSSDDATWARELLKTKGLLR